MAQQTINIGSVANDGTGDPLRNAFAKVNENFTELYSDDAGDVNSVTGSGGLTASPTTGAVVVSLNDDSITQDKLANEFKTTDAKGSVSGAQTLDFGANQVFTATITASTTFGITNAEIGMVKDLYVTGDFDLIITNGKKVAGTYNGTVTNLIQIVAQTPTSFWYSVSQEQV